MRGGEGVCEDDHVAMGLLGGALSSRLQSISGPADAKPGPGVRHGKTRYTTAMMAADPLYTGESESDLWPINGFSGFGGVEFGTGTDFQRVAVTLAVKCFVTGITSEGGQSQIHPRSAQDIELGSGASPTCCGGDGWESNPPGTAQHRPTDGFEDLPLPAELEIALGGPINRRFQDRREPAIRCRRLAS